LPIVKRGSEVLENIRPVSHYSLKEGDRLTVTADEAKMEERKTKSSVSSKSSDPMQQNYDDSMSEDKKEALLASFASGATSSNVEIVFSFDTTGSMSSCLGEVRKKVQETGKPTTK
jgi:hypothetical protein